MNLALITDASIFFFSSNAATSRAVKTIDPMAIIAISLPRLIISALTVSIGPSPAAFLARIRCASFDSMGMEPLGYLMAIGPACFTA